jgi:hypothetical protein
MDKQDKWAQHEIIYKEMSDKDAELNNKLWVEHSISEADYREQMNELTETYKQKLKAIFGKKKENPST